MKLESIYEDAVFKETDRLARLSPCELMKLGPKSFKVQIESVEVELAHKIDDFGSVRHIGVLAEIPNAFGVVKRKFHAGLKIQLSSERMTDAEASALYD